LDKIAIRPTFFVALTRHDEGHGDAGASFARVRFGTAGGLG
jgi:hypothetical protein